LPYPTFIPVVNKFISSERGALKQRKFKYVGAERVRSQNVRCKAFELDDQNLDIGSYLPNKNACTTSIICRREDCRHHLLCQLRDSIFANSKDGIAQPAVSRISIEAGMPNSRHFNLGRSYWEFKELDIRTTRVTAQQGAAKA
jgi:hypothetical protein